MLLRANVSLDRILEVIKTINNRVTKEITVEELLPLFSHDVLESPEYYIVHTGYYSYKIKLKIDDVNSLLLKTIRNISNVKLKIKSHRQTTLIK